MPEEAYPAAPMPERNLKPCTLCGRVLSLDGFHRSAKAKDGRQSRCKDCQRDHSRQWVQNNRERANARLRQWRAENPDLVGAAYERWQNANREKVKAHHCVQDAVRYGSLVKPDACEQCGSLVPAPRLHAHHNDYSKPRDVEWLCAGCHRARHPREITTRVHCDL